MGFAMANAALVPRYMEEDHEDPREHGHGLLSLVVKGALIGAGALAGLSLYTARHLNRPRKPDLLDDYFISPFELQTPHRDIEFQSEDGLTLRGWWFRREEEERTIIACSGRFGQKADLIGIGTGLWRAGFNVIAFDCRGRGESDRGRTSVGYYEMMDIRAARNFARHQIANARIGLLGYSMGAALAIQLAAEDPRIRAVVADSSFASLGDMIADYYSRRFLPGQLIASLAAFWNQLIYGWSIAEVSPQAEAAELGPRPLLVIHGADDSVVPLDHALRVHEAAGENSQLWVAEDADHCGAYFQNRAVYIQRVADFFESALAH